MTSDLITRLSKLDAPDREIDIELWRMFERPDAPADKIPLPWLFRYTASIDTVVALAERVLPGWKWGIHHHRGLIRAYVSETSPFRPMPVIADHGVPAIALLIALLRAKEASKL